MNYISHNHEACAFPPYGFPSSSDIQSQQNLHAQSFQQNHQQSAVPPKSTSTFSTSAFIVPEQYLSSEDYSRPRHSSHYTYPLAANPTEERGTRLTQAQSNRLQQKYRQKPKPNSNEKRQLAEDLGLTLQRVNNWFQNQRQNAKRLKLEQEAQCHKVLENAGRGRNLTFSELSSAISIEVKDTQTTPRQLTKSLATSAPCKMHTSTSSPTYSSKSEEAYASLARSIAAAQEAVQNGFQMLPLSLEDCPPLSALSVSTSSPQEAEYHNPGYSFDPESANYIPSSAFSDWGSSTCYTPTPYSQLDDPFEFDRSMPQSPYITAASARHPASALAPVFQADYSEFAAAVNMNAFEASFCMPLSQPPMGRKAIVPSNAAVEPRSVRPKLQRISTCPTLVAISRQTPTSIAKLSRSNSYVTKSSLLTADNSMRRIKSNDGGRVQKSVATVPRTSLRMTEQTTQSLNSSSDTLNSSSRRPSEAESHFSADSYSTAGPATPPTPASPSIMGLPIQKPPFDFNSPPITPQTAFALPDTVLNPFPLRVGNINLELEKFVAELPMSGDVFDNKSFSDSYMSFDDVSDAGFFGLTPRTSEAVGAEDQFDLEFAQYL